MKTRKKTTKHTLDAEPDASTGKKAFRVIPASIAGRIISSDKVTDVITLGGVAPDYVAIIAVTLDADS